ncbi:MAG TPA: transcription antitermination factor NusB, partial [Gemmatimonadaceae bacterium]|nr:transcription antitermination factor NusB [Gemmatimonadaceae bacterium]
KVADRVWFDLAVSPEERQFASGIVKTYARAQQQLDDRLIDVTDNWRLERIGAIERSVLRLGAAELEQGETPPRVVIQEAVRLAERFGSSSSARFVNGVLDAYARRAGVL